MPEFATFADLSGLLAKSADRESVIIARAKTKQGKTVFLSHSSNDKAYLAGVILLLENHGGRVYVDEGDSRLPTRPSKETAAILRDTIRALSRFVLFVTPSSRDSRWIPWELGLGDAFKTPSNVALLPASESALHQEWAKQEYLGLYKRIVCLRTKGSEEARWIVYDHITNTAEPLGDWLRGY